MTRFDMHFAALYDAPPVKKRRPRRFTYFAIPALCLSLALAFAVTFWIF